MTPTGCLHDLVWAQAARTPDAVAVEGGGDVLTYAELRWAASRFARRLRRRGVGAEARVGVCLERSTPLVVALLAVLEAGAAYVPLDPRYPRDRLAFMRDDARVTLLLTDAATPPELVPAGARVLRVGEAPGRDEVDEPGSPALPAGPDNLAYLVYTSGSTGWPKGVMVSHRAIVNHTRWLQDAFPMGPADRLLHKTPIGFDPSITEFLAPLVAGARLVLARHEGHQDPGYLVDTIIEREITVLQVVPTLLGLLVEQPRLGDCRSLRLVLSGGEALPLDLVDRLRSRLSVEVHNLYGPTEAAVDALCQPDVRPAAGGVAPIGRPIANAVAHLLDGDMRPVPDEEPGELYLGGLPLARGYHGRPDQTAARFVPNPFAVAPGPADLRLYRTGDLARRLPGGAVEFLGRTDGQVKIHGVRIEPGEIEAALREHPAVSEAVAVALQRPAGHCLVAYVGAGPGAGPELGRRLREHLADRLPAHLVPAAIVVLDALPRTPGGKLDRLGLPAVEPFEVRGDARRVAPRTSLERELAGDLARLLGMSRIGIEDELFDLGADSVVVARLGTHVQNRYDVRLPLFLLFAVPTVAGVAEVVEAYARDGGEVAAGATASLLEAEAVLDASLRPEWDA